MRNTIYVHPLDAIPFVYAATVRMVSHGSERYMEARGISAGLFEHLAREIVELLRDRELTASAIQAELHAEADLSSILYVLCDRGVLIRGRPARGWKDKNTTYALWAGYFPDLGMSMDEAEATRLLVGYYVAAFGPVTEADIVWWTGLGSRAVHGALARLSDEMVRVSVRGLGDSLIMLRSDRMLATEPSPAGESTVTLLPVQDPYLMGYKVRARYLDERWRDFVFDRSGNATSSIVVNGRVVGVWDSQAGTPPTIKVLLFEPVPGDVHRLIVERARAVGQFIYDCQVEVVQCPSMLPLTQRSAGSMMSPLKGC